MGHRPPSQTKVWMCRKCTIIQVWSCSLDTCLQQLSDQIRFKLLYSVFRKAMGADKLVGHLGFIFISVTSWDQANFVTPELKGLSGFFQNVGVIQFTPYRPKHYEKHLIKITLDISKIYIPETSDKNPAFSVRDFSQAVYHRVGQN